MRVDRHDQVQVLVLEDETDQVFNDDTVAALHAQLDDVEAVEGPTALVVTGRGKSFHTGLDLPFVGGLGGGFVPFIKSVHALFGRLYRSDVPVVAAINGHAIAGGAMLAQCADVRIMRADRGWFRLPEVELQLPFTVVMNDLLTARLPQPARHRMMVLGERMGGAQAAAAGVVDQAVEGEDAVIEEAVAVAASLAVHRGPVLSAIRTSLYRSLLRCIDEDQARQDLMRP